MTLYCSPESTEQIYSYIQHMDYKEILITVHLINEWMFVNSRNDQSYHQDKHSYQLLKSMPLECSQGIAMIWPSDIVFIPHDPY